MHDETRPGCGHLLTHDLPQAWEWQPRLARQPVHGDRLREVHQMIPGHRGAHDFAIQDERRPHDAQPCLVGDDDRRPLLGGLETALRTAGEQPGVILILCKQLEQAGRWIDGSADHVGDGVVQRDREVGHAGILLQRRPPDVGLEHASFAVTCGARDRQEPYSDPGTRLVCRSGARETRPK